MDVFHTLAEISVAITGFSSLIIIFRGSETEWSRLDYLSFGYVLSWSVGCIFLSLLPILLVELQLPLARAAQVGLFAVPAYILSIGVSLGYARSRITAEPNARGAQPVLRSAIGPGRSGFAMTFSAATISVGALLAAFGLIPGPGHGWYAMAIVLLMAHAIAEMGVFVATTKRRQNS